MAMFKYFTKKALPSTLPHPNGPLAEVIPSTSIDAANKEVQAIIESATRQENLGEESGPEGKDTKRGPYVKFSQQAKITVAKYATEHGVAAALRHFVKRFPELKESSIRTWRNGYIIVMQRKRKVGDDSSLNELPEKKRGRPLLLGDRLDGQVRSYIEYLRKKGAVVNTAIVLGVARGIVKSYDSNLLACNGGHLVLGKPWAKNLLTRMGYVKRRGSTAAKVSVKNFEQLKEQFLIDIKVVVEVEEIPADLIINWDQTGINYVPTPWTMEREGTKRVEIVAADDRRQITAVFAGTITGDFLPPQLIYKGTTPRCLPTTPFPKDWHITFNDNHWSNEATMIHYVEKILLPYIRAKRKNLLLGLTYPALVIFDNFSAQTTENVIKLLEDNHVRMAMVPPNCTDRLQPLDVSVNKAVKNFLRQEFENWYANQVCEQLRKGDDSPVDLKLSIIKPLGAQWIIGAYNHLKSRRDIVVNGFGGAGILASIKN